MRPPCLPNRSIIYNFARLVCAVLLTVANSIAAQESFAAIGQTGPSRSPTPQTGRSTVKGKVVYADNGRPLRRAEVTIYDPASRELRRHLMAWTDGRGEFQIKDVPAGKYFVVVNAPGIIRTGPLGSEEAQKELTSVTADGRSQSEVTVRVKRGGAISGKVTYADGDPALNASIRVLRRKEGKWLPVYVGGHSTDRALTDERGAYRVSSLPPGEYLVGAAEQKMGIELAARDDPEGSSLLNRALLLTTYYGGATSLSGATVLRVEAGEEKADVNITLSDRPVHAVSGVVILTGDNRPVARARISLKRKDEELALTSDLEEPVTNTDEQGRFTFDEVHDGSYVISVTPPHAYVRHYDDFPTATQAGANASQRFVAKHLDVSVGGADLLNLIVEVSSGGRATGTVTVEGGKPLPRSVLVYPEAAVRVRGEQTSSPIRVQPDGTFTLEGIPSGGVYLRAFVPPDNKYYTKSVTLGKVDLSRELLHVKEGETVTGLRIVISPDVAQLSGRILAADGKSPERGVGVLLVPADPDQQRFTGMRIYGFTNADGSFRVSGAPGEYLAVVMRPDEPPYQLSDDALRARTANAQRVSLQPGENNRLDLIVPSDK